VAAPYHRQETSRDVPRSYRVLHKGASGTGVSLASTVDSAHLASTTGTLNETTMLQELPRAQSQPWEVQEFDSRPSFELEHSRAPVTPMSTAFRAPGCEAAWDWSDSSRWWSERADWIQQRTSEILAAYNFFFEHIGLRKGWRKAPFQREEVQAPFKAAAEVVVVVRARLDAERGGVLVLRQVEGSAMNFLWGWSPSRPPGSSHKALEDFFRGLVFATLSDGRGLVEGLDSTTVESYVCRHPLLASREAVAAAAAEVAATAGAEAVAETEAATAAIDSDAPAAEPVAVEPCG